MRLFLEAMESGRLLDFVVAFMVLELALLAGWVGWRRRGGRPGGLSILDVVGHLSAGAFLVLALRSALVGDDIRWTAAFLLASLPAHLWDLVRRWRAAAG